MFFNSEGSFCLTRKKYNLDFLDEACRKAALYVVLSNLPVYDHKKSEWLQFSQLAIYLGEVKDLPKKEGNVKKVTAEIDSVGDKMLLPTMCGLPTPCQLKQI